MNTLEVRLGMMPSIKEMDFDKIHLNCDVYLCDAELDEEYRVWVPAPFYGKQVDYDNWVEELKTLAKNSGLKLVFSEPLEAVLQDIKNRDPELTLFVKAEKKRFREMSKSQQKRLKIQNGD